jgi:hypothetical protein
MSFLTKSERKADSEAAAGGVTGKERASPLRWMVLLWSSGGELRNSKREVHTQICVSEKLVIFRTLECFSGQKDAIYLLLFKVLESCKFKTFV